MGSTAPTENKAIYRRIIAAIGEGDERILRELLAAYLGKLRDRADLLVFPFLKLTSKIFSRLWPLSNAVEVAGAAPAVAR